MNADELERRTFVDAGGQCTYCPRLCRHACPVTTASGREALTPKAKMQTALELRENRMPLDEEAIATLWGCSACGACEDECLHHSPVGDALYAARAIARDRGQSPRALSGIIAEVEARESSEQLRAIDPAAHREVAERGLVTAEVGLLLERTATSGGGLGRSAFSIARRLHRDVKLAAMWDAAEPQTIVSGRPLREAGERAAYELHLQRVAHALRACGEWWVLEPSSLDDFEAAAKHLSPAPRVRALVEVIAERGVEPARRFRSLALQLGCPVRRRPRLEEALRVLAHRLSDDVRTQSIDMPFSGCCGGRGLIGRVLPEVAADMAVGHGTELAELKAEVTITFSEACHAQLPGIRHGVPLFADADRG